MIKCFNRSIYNEPRLLQKFLRYAVITRAAPINVHRGFSYTAIDQSGHSRWSKIKHDKAKVDARINKQRSQLAKDIELASKEGGSDLSANPRLASVLAAAKKAGFPKASCEAAIARGQGRSMSGAALDPMVIEVLHNPTGVALMIDCLTDNKAKTLQETREKLKLHDATQAPVAYLFERRGRLRLGNTSGDQPQVWDEDAVMEAALSAGALDIESESLSPHEQPDQAGSTSIIYTEPNEMAAVAQKMSTELGAESIGKELIWHPVTDMTIDARDSSEWGQLDRLIDQLEDDWAVTGVYLNAR